MPAGYRCHHNSINSVSSLSLSSASTSSTSCSDSDSESDSDCNSSGHFRNRATTGGLRMEEQRRHSRSTGRPRPWNWTHSDDDKGTPSPLESGCEDDPELEDGLLLGGSRPSGTARRAQSGRRKASANRHDICPLVQYGPGQSSHRKPAGSSSVVPSHLPPAYQPASAANPIPSNPHTFPQQFPSNHPLHIYHPPCLDGNLNLSIDVQTRQGPLTLFHLRMNSLRGREFSLRRYSRESGREICRSTRREKICPWMEDPLDFVAKKEAKREAKEEKQRQKSETKRKSEAANGNNCEKPGGNTHVPGKLNKSDDADQRDSSGSKPPTRDVILHQSLESPRTKTQFKQDKPTGVLRRVDSGYSSGSGGSVSPGLQAAAEVRAGCLRDSGLEHLEEEPDNAQLQGQLQDLAEPEADFEDAEPVAQRYRLTESKIKFEFSNYAHLDLRRKGTKAFTKRYEFDYWGVKYAWKRIECTSRVTDLVTPGGARESQRRHTIGSTQHDGKVGDVGTTVEFHLCCPGQSTPVAIIVPMKLSPEDSAIETDAGGWVPPSTFQILDEDILFAHNAADVCDVLVATGLIALVDESIKRQWSRSERESRFARLSKISPAMKLSFPRTWPKLNKKMFSPKKWSFSEDQNASLCASLKGQTLAKPRNSVACISNTKTDTLSSSSSAKSRRISLASSDDTSDLNAGPLHGFAARVAKFSSPKSTPEGSVRLSNPLRRLSLGTGS